MKTNRIKIIVFEIIVIFGAMFITIKIGVPIRIVLNCYLYLTLLGCASVVAYIIYFNSKCGTLIKKFQNNFDDKPILGFINKQLSKKNLNIKMRALLLIDRAMVLHYTGDDVIAMKIMHNVKECADNEFNPFYRTLYYNNLLSYLCDSESLDEAKKLYRECGVLFENKKILNKNRRLRLCIENTLSSYNVLSGEAEKSRDRLIESLPQQTNKIETLCTEYYIALADFKLGNKQGAIDRWKRILEPSRGIFWHDKIKAKLKASGST